MLNNTGHENGIDRKLGSGWLVVGKKIPVKREFIQEMSPRIGGALGSMMTDEVDRREVNRAGKQVDLFACLM